MTIHNEQLSIRLEINDDGSVELSSTRPSHESRLLADAAAEWVNEQVETWKGENSHDAP